MNMSFTYDNDTEYNEYNEYKEDLPSNHSYLNVLNIGEVSYIIKKYNNKSIISIFEKDSLKLTKAFENFFSENMTYLVQLKKEKYSYMFIGRKEIYEFNLAEGDTFLSFGCILDYGATYAYLIGEKYIYSLTDLKCFLDKKYFKFKKPHDIHDIHDIYDTFFDLEKENKHKHFEFYDKSKYIMGKKCDTKEKDIKEIIDIKEEILNNDLNKLIDKAHKLFNDIEKEYTEEMLDYKLTFIKTKSYAKKTIKNEMDKKKSWAKYKIDQFNMLICTVEEKNRVNLLKSSINDYLSDLYKENLVDKKYFLFLDRFNSWLLTI